MMNNFFDFRNRPSITIDEALLLQEALRRRAMVSPSKASPRPIKFAAEMTERTREIGIRKALGARRRSILMQFLFESAVICLVGGLVGIGIAAGLTALSDLDLRRYLGLDGRQRIPAVGQCHDSCTNATGRLRGVPRGEPDNFEMFNSASSIARFNQMTAGVKIAAFVVGTIALVVAGIGIMNIMLVSVTERTKEIGVRKSLGARLRDILQQFLLEAIVLCNVGGVIGVAVGFGFGNALVKFGMSPAFESVVPLEWAVVGLLFCSAIGLIFGMLPAMQAARLNPIDALRFE